jgi:hypothetical protein
MNNPIRSRTTKAPKPALDAAVETLSPEQFGALFNRSKSFGYRMIYSGRIRTIPGMRHSIPRSEVARFTAGATIYSGPKNAPRVRRGATQKRPKGKCQRKN